MPDESTTPDLVELTRRMYVALEREDFDAVLDHYAPEAVWRGTVDDAEGVAAIRDLWVSYYSAFEELRVILEEVVDFGNGVILAATRHVGRLVGGGALAESRAFVSEFVDGRVVRAYDYTDIDRARAAAERLAEERGDANDLVTLAPVEITRQRLEATSRGEWDLDGMADDYTSDAVVDSAGYGMGTFKGREAIRGFLADWASSFDDLTMTADEIVGFGNAVVLTVYHQTGRPLGASNYVRVRSAWVMEFVDGKVARGTIYTESEIDQARADAERLAQERG